MRLGLMSMGMALLVAAAPQAMAQSYNPNTTTGTTASGATYYAPRQNTTPVYNTGARPLPMDQIIAGQNAPSFNYRSGNQVQPYNLGNTGTVSGYNSGGSLSPADVARIRAQRDRNAQAYEQEYMQRAAQGGSVSLETDGSATPGSNNYGTQQPQIQRKKRLVYREDANPLRTPPRLFNID